MAEGVSELILEPPWVGWGVMSTRWREMMELQEEKQEC